MNLNRLWAGKNSKKKCERNCRRFVCDNCLNPFLTAKSLENHKESCEQFDAVKTVLPKEGTFMSFKKLKKKRKCLFEFMPILNRHKSAEQFQEHIPCGFCSHTVSMVDEVEFSPVLFRGKNVAKEFVKQLVSHVKDLHNKYGKKRIVWKDGERNAFEPAEVCWLCGGELSQRKVADHCHFTGKFRGAAHSGCNLLARKPKFTPVFFHNLAGYDAHLFVKNLGKQFGVIKCIPNTEEK